MSLRRWLVFGNDKAAFKPTEASFENYENLVPGARQLLISTTGTWTPGDQRKTYLEILPTRDIHDSRLSVAEIAAIPLTADYRAYRQGGPGGSGGPGGKGLRKDQALTEARRRSRERGDPAQVWAAWVLVGDAR